MKTILALLNQNYNTIVTFIQHSNNRESVDSYLDKLSKHHYYKIEEKNRFHDSRREKSWVSKVRLAFFLYVLYFVNLYLILNNSILYPIQLWTVSHL